ncbi:collagen-binding domain-containing protein [Puniceibacterium sediminis]|uniref:VPLPA-CTERM protein sorting domain-containing protein n=1 Tax=Puniceibacterium sediminis TaxID=1608407 RepID=A0A238WN86_9RHOB|nr:collagen-binding domain-containing protein [Puniceibacterium sediminis]SNR47851.1 VPLPA-CTERM protein sorting domain-containing protein [Puniceibacterium sediminis]
MKCRLIATVSAAIALFCAGTVGAATMNANEILNQFNLVTFSDHALSSNVHGRAFVGGDLTGNSGGMTTSNYTPPASSFADVTVVGDVRSGDVNTRGHATVDIGGSIISGRVNNASSVTTGVADLTQVRDEFQATLTAASVGIRDMASNATTTAINTNQGTRFSGVAGAVTVFDVSAASFIGNELDIVLNGASAIFINVSGTNLSFSQNFNTDQNVGANVIWNFFEAETLHLGNRFVGSVLAPLATVSNSNNIFGTLVANEFNQNGQVHQQAWAGSLPLSTDGGLASSVPLPAAIWMLFAALGGLAVLRRKF